MLKQRIAPFYYRIRKSDFDPKLPSPIFHKEFIEMATGKIRDSTGSMIGEVDPCPNQDSIYYAIEGRVYSLIKKEMDRKKSQNQPSWEEITELRKWQKARLLRLLQVASNPALLTRQDSDLGIDKISSAGLPIYKKILEYPKLKETPSKLQRAKQIAKQHLDASTGAKILIWTSFIQNIYELKKTLKDYSPAIVFGDIAKDQDENKYFNRIDEVARFKNSTECRVLIANPASLAESVSLHKNKRGEVVCTTAIYLIEHSMVRTTCKSLDRIHRIGLKEESEGSVLRASIERHSGLGCG